MSNRFPAASGCIFVLICALLSSSLPVLDEESYLWISQEMQWGRPYDWSLPWPPYDDAYVYAHPPLFLWWVKLFSGLAGDSLGLIKFVLGAPWQFLIGACIGRLLVSNENRWLLFFLWSSAPIAALGASRALMPDLMCSALGIFGLLCFIEAGQRQKATLFYALAGLALGLAAWTKYPALLLWGVVFAFHKGGLKRLIPMIATFFAIFVLGEVWLWALYGECHLWVVLSRADEIARNGFWGRFWGLLDRFVWGVPFAFLFFRWRPFLLCLIGLVVTYALFDPSRLPIDSTGHLVSNPASIAFFYLLGTALSLSLLFSGLRRHSLYSFWALLPLLGVLIFHNFSAPRYLLPMLAPLIAFVTLPRSKLAVMTLLIASAMMTIFMNQAERRFAKAADECAVLASELGENGRYLGEWTHRWRLRKAGWSPWRPDDQGELLAIPENAAAVEPPEGWVYARRYDCLSDGFTLISSRQSIGWYSETLGGLPFGFTRGSLESIDIYERTHSGP